MWMTPRKLPFDDDLIGVHVLRTIDDALALSGDLLRSSAVVVVGAGFLDTEAAASARQLISPATEWVSCLGGVAGCRRTSQ